MAAELLPRIAMKYRSQEQRGLGRPKKRWKDQQCALIRKKRRRRRTDEQNLYMRSDN
jgi:hypothetical protein